MRKKITWKPGVSRNDPVPRPHSVEERLLPDKERMLMSGELFIGAMCVLTSDLEVEKTNNKYIAPPYPITFQSWSPVTALLKRGAIAVYAGPVRDEMQGKAGIIHVMRHTFIVGGGRYIVSPNHVQIAG